LVYKEDENEAEEERKEGRVKIGVNG